MTKVLRILNRFNLGGPTFNAAYLSRYLQEEGFETLLIGGERDNSEESSLFIPHQLGIDPVVLPEMKRAISPVDDYRAFRRICQIIDEFKPEIVHTHASKAGFLGRLAARRRNVKVVLHTFHGHVFHSYFSSPSSYFYKTIERSLAARTDKIIAISERQKEELLKEHRIAPEKKFEVIPLGFDLERFWENVQQKRDAFRNFYRIGENEMAVGIIGRLTQIKNHAFFIDVVARVIKETGRNVRFFIIGDGEDKPYLMHLCKEKGIPFSDWLTDPAKATVTFTSWIKDIDRANAGLDIICLTSLNEGTPVSLIEAQAASKPVISTLAGGIENAVVPEKSAILVKQGDLEGFVSGLRKLIEDADHYQYMSKWGKPFVAEKYSYKRLVDDTAALYRRLLAEKTR